MKTWVIMTDITIRIDSINPKHIRFTIFQDGGNAGQLCMESDAGDLFIDSLCESPYFNVKVIKSGLA